MLSIYPPNRYLPQVGVVTALLQKLDVLGRDESHDERGKGKDRDKDRRTLDIVAATEAMLAAWELVRSLLLRSHTGLWPLAQWSLKGLALLTIRKEIALPYCGFRACRSVQAQAAKTGNLASQAASPRSALNIPHSNKTVPTDWRRFEKALVMFRCCSVAQIQYSIG